MLGKLAFLYLYDDSTRPVDLLLFRPGHLWLSPRLESRIYSVLVLMRGIVPSVRGTH